MQLTCKTILAAFAVTAVASAPAPVHAETIANWQILGGSTSSTSGLTTDSPTFGSGSADDFTSVTFGSLLGANGAPTAVSLDAIGDTLTVTADVTLTGGTNTGSQFRFGVFNDNGNFGTTNTGYLGGWNYIVGTDLYAARTDNNFMSNGGNAVDLNADKATAGSFAGDSAAPYTWTMSITRSSATTVDIVSNFAGGDSAFDQTYTKLGQATTLFSYNTLGSLSGGTSGLDQLSIANAQYTKSFTPITLFGDDFEGYAPNSDITTAGPWGTAGSTAGQYVVRDESTATPFGTPNQYGELADTGGASIRLQSPDITDAVGAVTTFSFDFNEPDTGGGNLIVGYSVNNGDLNASGSRQAINLNNGFITGLTTISDNAYDLDTSYTLYMIYNDSGASYDYEGGTIANGEAHVWIEELDTGNFIFVGTSDEQNAATVESSYRVGFRSFSSNVQTVLVDNVSLTTGAAAVPEPASLALLGLGGALIARRRRR